MLFVCLFKYICIYREHTNSILLYYCVSSWTQLKLRNFLQTIWAGLSVAAHTKLCASFFFFFFLDCENRKSTANLLLHIKREKRSGKSVDKKKCWENHFYRLYTTYIQSCILNTIHGEQECDKPDCLEWSAETFTMYRAEDMQVLG